MSTRPTRRGARRHYRTFSTADDTSQVDSLRRLSFSTALCASCMSALLSSGSSVQRWNLRAVSKLEAQRGIYHFSVSVSIALDVVVHMFEGRKSFPFKRVYRVRFGPLVIGRARGSDNCSVFAPTRAPGGSYQKPPPGTSWAK